MEDEKKVRRKQVITGIAIACGFVGIVMAGLAYVDSTSGTPSPTVSNTPKVPDVSKNFAMPADQGKPEDQWMASGNKQLNVQGEEMKTLQERMRFMEEKLKAEEAAKANGTTLPPVPAPPTNTGNTNGRQALADSLLPPPPLPPQQPANATPIDPNGAGMTFGPDGKPVTVKPEGIQVIEFDKHGANNPNPLSEPEKNGEGANSEKRISSYVPAGSFATVTLLNGLDAPTGGQASQNALPVVMRVKSFMRLPNLYQTNLRECFITGSAYGDLASERAIIRTEKLSCVMNTGEVLEVKLKGHLAGEDGSFGMRGKVVSKQGMLIAKSFFAGLFSGIGTTIAQQSTTVSTSALGTTTTLDPDKALQAGLSQGLATSSNKVGEFYLAQANSIFPVIEIAAKRIGEVFLMDGVDFGKLSVASTGSQGESL